MEKIADTTPASKSTVRASVHCIEGDCDVSHNVFDSTPGGWVSVGSRASVSVDTATLARDIADHFLQLADAIIAKDARRRSEAIAAATARA